jgi:hypothetical protein
MNKSRFVKTRLSVPEYVALCARADEKGVTVSEYLRELVTGQRETLDLQGGLTRIESRLEAAPVADSRQEAMAAESLLLLRELVAGVNTQVLSQVAQRMSTLYPSGRVAL